MPAHGQFQIVRNVEKPVLRKGLRFDLRDRLVRKVALKFQIAPHVIVESRCKGTENGFAAWIEFSRVVGFRLSIESRQIERHNDRLTGFCP